MNTFCCVFEFSLLGDKNLSVIFDVVLTDMCHVCMCAAVLMNTFVCLFFFLSGKMGRPMTYIVCSHGVDTSSFTKLHGRNEAKILFAYNRNTVIKEYTPYVEPINYLLL